jgi:hypothetical protein
MTIYTPYSKSKNALIVSLLLISLLLVLGSCGILKKESTEDEEEFVISRKFVGTFIDFRYTPPEDIAGQHIIWLKTSLEGIYGKISVQGKKCNFTEGERLYLKRTLYDPGIGAGYWIYHVENDSATVSYEATEFQHDKKVPVENWFNNKL